MASYTGSNAEGQKAERLAKLREEQRKEFEARKEIMRKEASVGLKDMNELFQSHTATQAEEDFRSGTIGLVSAEDFKRKRELIAQHKEREEQKKADIAAAARKRKESERKAKLKSLSFSMDDEEEEEEFVPKKKGRAASHEEEKNKKKQAEEAEEKAKEGQAEEEEKKRRQEEAANKKKLKKDPTVDTTFLPDREREAEEQALREQLAAEWKAQQDRIKAETIEVTYSYWDGSGHRRTIKVTKGTRIDQFLEKCRRDLVDQFHELRGMSSVNLMYIKEDLIIPHHYSFYDLIVTKARGKSGPLFHFDVHDDVRMLADARVEKDESHAGKIVTRAYYERNQHIFPVNRWEVYDPTVVRDKYTIK